MSSTSNNDDATNHQFQSNMGESPDVLQLQNLPPPNIHLSCPPPVTNSNFPPYSFISSPHFYAIPPPLPYMGHNPPFNFYLPVNVPPPYSAPAQNVAPPAAIPTVKMSLPYSNILKEEKVEVLFPNAVKKASIASEVKLWEVSKYFRIFHLLLKDLENELDSISQDDVAMDSENYKRSCERINLKQEKLISHKKSIHIDSTFLSCLKYKISKRKKKRKYRRRVKKSKSHILVYEIANMHMQQLQQDANNIKQEEKLKQEADNILSSVIQKKADARYQIQLLSNLLKLHSARVHQLTVETQLTVDESISGCEKLLEKLKSLWESKLHEYTTEENGLKLMINELAVNAEDEDCKKLKKTYEKWLQFIFGTNNLQSEEFYLNYDQLIEIRQGWDKYVVDERGTRGSKIPAGWVIPKYNDNETWRKFLFQ